MSQTPISEIRDKYKKTKVALICLYFLFVIILVVVLFSTHINYSDNIIAVLFLLIIAVSAITPEISEYDLIRFHLNELITFLNERNPKKSEQHIDKLAHTIKELNQTTDNSFIFNSTKSTLDNLWNLLKYRIYPTLNDDDFNSYIETLKDINNAFDNENLNYLNETVGRVIIDSTELRQQNMILFPYEKPNSLTQKIQYINNKLFHIFKTNFVFRFICVASVVFIIGYFFSIKISSLNFDSTFISALSLVSVGIAKEI